MKNYTIKITNSKKVIHRLETASKRRFLRQLRTIKSTKAMKYYLRVHYGTFKDAFNKLSKFYNDGNFETKKDLIKAFYAFDEN